MTLAPGSRLGPYTIVDRLGAGGMGEVYRAKAVSAAPSPIFETPFTYPTARFSPDGRWLAYANDETGEVNVYVVSWPLSQERLHVSTDGGGMARWARDGRELFYLSSAGLMSVPMAGGSPGKPALLLDRRAVSRWSDYDVAPDGRFLAIVPESIGGQEPLTVVVNWRSRVP